MACTALGCWPGPAGVTTVRVSRDWCEEAPSAWSDPWHYWRAAFRCFAPAPEDASWRHQRRRCDLRGASFWAPSHTLAASLSRLACRIAEPGMASLPAVVRQITVGLTATRRASCRRRRGPGREGCWGPPGYQPPPRARRSCCAATAPGPGTALWDRGHAVCGPGCWLHREATRSWRLTAPTCWRRGKSASGGARARPPGPCCREATTPAKAANGTVEMLRVLRVAARLDQGPRPGRQPAPQPVGDAHQSEGCPWPGWSGRLP